MECTIVRSVKRTSSIKNKDDTDASLWKLSSHMTVILQGQRSVLRNQAIIHKNATYNSLTHFKTCVLNISCTCWKSINVLTTKHVIVKQAASYQMTLRCEIGIIGIKNSVSPRLHGFPFKCIF